MEFNTTVECDYKEFLKILKDFENLPKYLPRQLQKIQILENNLSKLDLVSSFEILKFNNENIYFKIIYNGSPNKFIDEMKEKNVEITTQNSIWEIK